ncbi:hypothetical protein TanjilG_28872 [Lupinus angustifolius]|uniref:BAG domain-containing protein n=1 Tax=Lupinus angustifolius TaxID=3871 RepID=A0A4P1R8V1_LUPAN|nr:PREDICTED: BAG family molecular chaperone regulator 8, chloroplastic [Lupinus angustifolius]OIW05407.1 hypothetical protein TanjilG_28872 [Lupinus angustifolius]
MASHHRNHHHNHHQPSPPSTNCCCNPSSYTCCTQPTLLPPPPPPPPQDHHHNHHLIQAFASLLSQQQQHFLPTQYPKSHPHKKTILTQTYNNQINSTISSLLNRIESLESSLNNQSYSYSLRDTAARVIQIHFRSFLVRRSKTLRHLKELGFIKSTFNALKSSFSDDATRSDFAALSQKALDLLLHLDSIEGSDPMVIDGKRLISRDLVQFLDSIERVAAKKHLFYVKAVKNARFGQNFNKPRDSSDDEKRKLLQNLRGRVEKISKLCKVYENDEDSEPEGIDYDGDHSVLISRRNGVSANKNVVFMQRQGTAKESVKFAENGKFCEVHSSNTYEPDLSGDVTCLDGSSSSDDQGEVLENVEDVLDSSQSAEGDDEVLVEGGGSRYNTDDGEKNDKKNLKSGGRNTVKGQLPMHREKPIISAPLPLKMENKADAKSKGVRILP